MGGNGMDKRPEDFDLSRLSGRNRRLLYEWKHLEEMLSTRNDISYEVIKCNSQGLPVGYTVAYHIRSIQSVEQMELLDVPGISNAPVWGTLFYMGIYIPENYPCVDAPAEYRFLTHDSEGNPIPHPWHPNIRYFGEFKGRVCLNIPDTYASLAWGVDRVSAYLRYDLYHAVQEPPYPEDPKVARWVIRQGEPNKWIYFDQ